MKTRESGMPDESMWAGFFSPEQTLVRLELAGTCRDVVDFGCGYGTFSIPAARIVRGAVHALDIETEMIEATVRKAKQAGLDNVRVERRDFVTDGTGLPAESVDYVMLFNILHCERPELLLGEAYRVLSTGGRLGIMHWNYDPATPRGPTMGIRPRPEQCRTWAETVGFGCICSLPIDLPPHHYGWIMEKR
ncbi:MAG: methyltransferase domain-containing protein [Planctomycetes bacterium]|nr:methyltransferase domain-containing protein [Planctomycetota bacterium]